MFQKAIRKKVKLKLGITGPTGSGKTYSALRLAKGLGGKIAVIDTENGSASLYSDTFEFDVLDMKPPFTTEKYIEAINAAEKAGYDTIIIDSLTHSWDGEGGLLQQKAALDSRPGSNHWTNWGPIDKKYKALNDAFLHSKCNVIATLRSKMEYTQADDNGKKKIQKVGMAPIYRDGVSYEFTIMFDVAMNHECEVSKDRTGIFTDKIFKITEDTGQLINAWIDTGNDEPAVAKANPPKVQGKPYEPPQTEPVQYTADDFPADEPPPFFEDDSFPEEKPKAPENPPKGWSPTTAQLKRLFALKTSAHWSDDELKVFLNDKCGVDSTKKLNYQQYNDVCKMLEAKTPYNRAINS